MRESRRPYISSVSDQARRARVYCDKPGIYAVRLVKNGTEAALRLTYEPAPDPATGEINLDRSHWWRVFINGREVGDPSLQPPTTLYIGRPVEQWEYDFILADHAWAQQNDPHSPEADPYRGKDLRTARPVF